MSEGLDIKVGDRIRQTSVFEGVVTSVDVDFVTIQDDSPNAFINLLAKSSRRKEITTEILERAKPVWQDGDVAVFRGNTRHRLGGTWFSANGNVQTSDDTTADWFGYKLILRDGKPVS